MSGGFFDHITPLGDATASNFALQIVVEVADDRDMKTLIAGAALLVTACQVVVVDTEWQMDEVVVSPMMSEECYEAHRDSVEFWSSQGAGLAVRRGDSASERWEDQWAIGRIWASHSLIEGESSVAGRARKYHAVDGRVGMVGLTYQEGYCSNAWVVSHEIGHALGLGHSDDPNNIMYPEYLHGENGFDVSCDQLESIGVECKK